MTVENRKTVKTQKECTIAGGGISGIVTNQQWNQFACARVACEVEQMQYEKHRIETKQPERMRPPRNKKNTQAKVKISRSSFSEKKGATGNL